MIGLLMVIAQEQIDCILFNLEKKTEIGLA